MARQPGRPVPKGSWGDWATIDYGINIDEKQRKVHPRDFDSIKRNRLAELREYNQLSEKWNKTLMMLSYIRNPQTITATDTELEELTNDNAIDLIDGDAPVLLNDREMYEINRKVFDLHIKNSLESETPIEHAFSKYLYIYTKPSKTVTSYYEPKRIKVLTPYNRFYFGVCDEDREKLDYLDDILLEPRKTATSAKKEWVKVLQSINKFNRIPQEDLIYKISYKMSRVPFLNPRNHSIYTEYKFVEVFPSLIYLAYRRQLHKLYYELYPKE